MRIIHIERLKETNAIHRTQLVPLNYGADKLAEMIATHNNNQKATTTYETIEVDGALADVVEHILSKPTRTISCIYDTLKSSLEDIDHCRDAINDLSDNVYSVKRDIKDTLEKFEEL